MKTLSSSIKVGLTRIVVLVVPLVLILPVTFVLVHSLFQGNESIDKKVLLEELTKGGIGLIVSVSVIFISEGLVRIQNSKKADAVKLGLYIEIEPVKQSITQLIHHPSFVLEAELELMSVEELRTNSRIRKEFEELANDIVARLQTVANRLLTEDPILRAFCFDYQLALGRSIGTIQDYLNHPSLSTAESLKSHLSELLTLQLQTGQLVKRS